MLDVLISGGLVADGTGAPLRRADVGVSGGRLVLLPGGGPADSGGARVIDATGLVVAPGFIDVHTHSDAVTLLGEAGRELAAAPVRMGVTVEICGNCGSSLFPALPERVPALRRSSRAGFGGDVPIFLDYGAFVEEHERAPRSNHLTSLVGHGT
ncbi:MAG: N-acyl-D-amino-acid deacylase, partial [Nonomuraea muscovyensis]|nr:N-acyl-D-amino-acid deacylase [Nonomuraea muscovyensis]